MLSEVPSPTRTPESRQELPNPTVETEFRKRCVQMFFPFAQNRPLAEQEFLKSAVASRETRRHWKCREEAIPRYVHTLQRKLEPSRLRRCCVKQAVREGPEKRRGTQRHSSRGLADENQEGLDFRNDGQNIQVLEKASGRRNGNKPLLIGEHMS